MDTLGLLSDQLTPTPPPCGPAVAGKQLVSLILWRHPAAKRITHLPHPTEGLHIMTSHLLGLKAEQFKRLELVELDFTGQTGTYAVMGANEAGKSSLLDALESVLAGRKATKFEQPIHDDGDEARIVATFDDIIVTRTFKKGKPPTITVTGTDGRRFANTEEIMKALYAHVALDPLAFSRLKDDEQVATLLPLIGYDPKKDDDATFTARFNRTAVGRDRDAAKARRDGITLPKLSEPLPAVLVSVAALSDELAVALGKNNEREGWVRTAEQRAREVAEGHQRVQALEIELEEEVAAVLAHINAHERAVEILATRAIVDVEPIRAAILTAETTNNNISQRDEYARLDVAYNSEMAEYAALTQTIEKIAARKKKALSEAKMPVPKLTIDPESNLLMFAGTPFSQASTGVMIRTGVAIAMALNPNLRLIIIRDASLLDAGNRKVIDDIAKANDFLVLMELADENAPVGVVIEQGTVREVR